ncbi:hypothetical protein QOT17_011856 [Balamuthia mandrillaris]
MATTQGTKRARSEEEEEEVVVSPQTKDKEKEEEEQQEEGATKKARSEGEKAAAAAGVRIISLDLKGDCVTLLNDGLEDVDLSGWILQSVTGNQNFVFEEKFTLKAGGSVTIWSGGANEARHNPPSSFFWTKRYIWNDKGDKAVLKNAQEEVVDERTEQPPPSRQEQVIIQSMLLKEECVVLLNHSSEVVDLSGWFLRSVVGDQYFLFGGPDRDCQLQPGQSVAIWSGRQSEPRHNPPASFLWTKRYIWNDKGDAAAIYNNKGELVDKLYVFPEDAIPATVEPPVRKA